MSEIHLFIVWSNAKEIEKQIVKEIKQNLIIKKIYHVKWSKEKFSENLTRFYGEYLPNGSEKEEHCGNGIFTCIIVEDKAPIYQTRQTTRGFRKVNINIFDIKIKYRILTGRSHKIHSTDNEMESEHDIALLFDRDCEYFRDMPDDPDTIYFLSRDLTGANGWSSIDKLFDFLNRFTDYIVLRNYECLMDDYTMDEHGDIDLLVSNKKEAIYLCNAKKVFDISYRVLHKININGEEVLFDFRHLGDDYYEYGLEKLLLKTKRFDKKGFFKPEKKLYFITLLYHALVHKLNFSIDYQKRLKNLAKEVDADISMLKADPKLLLFDYLDKFGFKLTRPKDYTVYFNQDVVDRYIAYQNLKEIFTFNYDIHSILLKDDRFFIHYVLSPLRENILKWYPFKKEASILLIDEGCGALVKLLQQKAKDLTILEPSSIEMEITTLRYKDEDIHFVNSSLQDFMVDDKYDYIVAIGIISYIKDHFIKLKQFLKKDGIFLLLAEEDIFSSEQIKNSLKSIGFKNFSFYYPYPDPIYPEEIYAKEFLPTHLQHGAYIVEAKI